MNIIRKTVIVIVCIPVIGLPVAGGIYGTYRLIAGEWTAWKVIAIFFMVMFFVVLCFPPKH
jgi:hypothetical protein